MRHWLAAYLRRRFAWLLVLLLATIGIDPVLESVGLEARALEWVLALALFAAAVGASARGPHLARALALLFTVTFGGWLVLTLGARDTGSPAEPALLGVACLVMAILLLAVVLGRGRVDAERICAALCVYLLTGIAFGGLFAALQALSPGSLRAGGDDIGGAIYFSFVTLATLGYGDVVPVTPAMRSLAILEAVMGQFYVAVLVARLVSAYARERGDD